MTKQRLINVFGWYGAVAILTAYALLSFNFLLASSLVFQFLNLTGAFGIALASLSKKDYPPAALNAFWALVAVFALLRIVLG